MAPRRGLDHRARTRVDEQAGPPTSLFYPPTFREGTESMTIFAMKLVSSCVAMLSTTEAFTLTMMSSPPGNARAKTMAAKELVQSIKKAKGATDVSRLVTENDELLNAFVVTAAMSKLRRFGRSQEALDLFENAKERGITDSSVSTYNAAISACRDWQKALEIFDDLMGRDLEPTMYTYNAMISACAKARQWQKAVELFDDLTDRGLEPDIITYSALISACEKGRQWKRALWLFDDLKERGLEPELITYNSLISACGKAGQWSKALQVLD